MLDLVCIESDMPNLSIPALFREQVSKLRIRPMIYSRRDRHWRPLTWLQIENRVNAAASGLIDMGIEPGDRVAIIGQSSVEWVIADLAALSCAAVDVAISETASFEDILWILNDSQAKIAFVGDPDLLEKLSAARDQLPQVTTYIAFHEAVTVLDNIEIDGMSLLRLENRGYDAQLFSDIESRIEEIAQDDLMTLIYTSGTTGTPKGVMISHRNMIENCQACLRAIPIQTDDVLLSFLPLSHSFERMAGYYMPAIFGGATIYFSHGMDRLMKDLEEVRPTLMTGVPKLYEKIYSQAQRLRNRAHPAKRVVMDIARSFGSRVTRKEQKGRTASKLLELQYTWVRDRVFSGLHESLGGRVRFFVSGGAPLAVEIAEFFFSAGILILEGYGLTETTPVVSVNRPNAYQFGSVGRPLDNVRVRIADDGEILVKAPSVMMGYWNQEKETDRIISDDGWLKTGDIGTMDRDGFLRITDRKKDLYKDTGGRYIAPQKVEGLLRLDPFIEQVCLIGDGRPHCVALIVPHWESLEEWAQDKRIPFEHHEALGQEPAAQGLIQRTIHRVNQKLAKHETIRAFKLLTTPFTTEDSLLTPSLKVRRNRVMVRYAAEIDALYQSDHSESEQDSDRHYAS